MILALASGVTSLSRAVRLLGFTAKPVLALCTSNIKLQSGHKEPRVAASFPTHELLQRPLPVLTTQPRNPPRPPTGLGASSSPREAPGLRFCPPSPHPAETHTSFLPYPHKAHHPRSKACPPRDGTLPAGRRWPDGCSRQRKPHPGSDQSHMPKGRRGMAPSR
jgi:hypothetical protein